MSTPSIVTSAGHASDMLSAGPPSFEEAALQIARAIRDQRLVTKDGHPTWLVPSGYGTPGHPFRQIRPTAHLYDGTTGIAVFLAAFARQTADDSYRELALRTIAPFRAQLVSWLAEAPPSQRFGIQVGGLIGIGSFIYAFSKIGEWLDEPSLIDEAHDLTRVLTEERLALDHHHRIQTGCAGALLALLEIHRKRPGPNRDGWTPLDLSERCVEHLTRCQIAVEGFAGRAWPLSPNKPPLAGFSYGAAGISYALGRFRAASGSDAATEAEEDGWRFVDALYSPQALAWRDPRLVFQSRYRLLTGGWKDWWASGTPDQLEPLEHPEPPSDACLDLWCHGAAGMALALLLAPDRPDATRERARAVLNRLSSRDHSAETHVDPVDDICCGSMGQADVLMRASETFAGTGWRVAARDVAIGAIERARQSGRYNLSSARGRDVFAPGLFQGLAGVGYSFLRLAAPGELPSLLLLE